MAKEIKYTAGTNCGTGEAGEGWCFPGSYGGSHGQERSQRDRQAVADAALRCEGEDSGKLGKPRPSWCWR